MNGIFGRDCRNFALTFSVKKYFLRFYLPFQTENTSFYEQIYSDTLHAYFFATMFCKSRQLSACHRGCISEYLYMDLSVSIKYRHIRDITHNTGSLVHSECI